jgi:DNA polymerase V
MKDAAGKEHVANPTINGGPPGHKWWATQANPTINGGPPRPVYINVPVSAGFPSPAGDYIETPLDLNELLIPRPAATFFIRAAGESMDGAGIGDGDLLVVDRSMKARSGDIVVAVVDGEFTVKRFIQSGGTVRLDPANTDFQSIPVVDGSDVEIWGVVSYVIHATR